MKIFHKTLFGLLLFCIPSFSSADEYWTEEVETSGQYAQFTQTDFDFFTLHIPYGTQAEMFFEGKWEILERETEDTPHSILTELISWERGETLTLRFRGTALGPITADFMKIDDVLTSSKNILTSSGRIGGLRIHSRKDWGADENWRYNSKSIDDFVENKDSGVSLSKRESACVSAQKSYPDEFEIKKVQSTEGSKVMKWPYQYSKKVRKVVIHHTAESGVRDGKEAVQVLRGIYRYHAISRKWGDIGYHFIIDPNGEIYEGRAGGDFVVGGHVYCHNIGTIGVAMMGNFETGKPTTAQQNALKKLLPELADIYELDLTETGWYHGKNTENLLGHRDLTPTVCPGKNVYSLLPTLRRTIEKTSGIQRAKSLSVDGVPAKKLSVIQMKPGETKDIHLEFENTGQADWLNASWIFAQSGKGVTLHSMSSRKKYVAAKQKEKTVSTGGIAHFTARVTAGYKGGIYTISFTPVVRDERVKNAEILQVIEVESPDWSADLKNIKTQPIIPVSGKATSLSVQLKNTGETRWKTEETQLAVSIPGTNIQVNFPIKTSTNPGGIATFSGRIPALSSADNILLSMRILVQGKRTPITLIHPLIIEKSKDKAIRTGNIKRLLTASTGDSITHTFSFKNAGSAEWKKENLALHMILRRQKTILRPKESSILPGETATFTMTLPVKKGIQPYVYALKNGTHKLHGTVFLLHGIGEKKASFPPDRNREKNSTITSSRTSSSVNTKKSSEMISQNSDIRIHLSFPETKTSAKITGENTFLVFDANGKRVLTGRKGDGISIQKNGNLLKLNGKSSPLFTVKSGTSTGILSVSNWERYPAWDTNKKWNDNRFYGNIEVRIIDGKLTLINELSLEKYMEGIGETTESNHFEKKKALSIVARSYATFYQSAENRKYPGKPYDGSDNPAEFQKYLGASLGDRSPDWKKALAATEGQLLYFKNEVVKPPYHTCSGGQTTSAKEKWGWTTTPYLISVDDPGCAGKPRAGHGVGMSGGGAQYFAEQNWSYKNILKYYYPGTEVK